MNRVVHHGTGYNPDPDPILILVLIFYPSRIPHPRVKKAPDPGSGSATLISIKNVCKKTANCMLLVNLHSMLQMRILIWLAVTIMDPDYYQGSS
jgi:hypothetical protein